MNPDDLSYFIVDVVSELYLSVLYIVNGCAQPYHDTICSFRKRHQEAFGQIFSKVLHLCCKAGLVKLGHISIDGSKIKANASKHKAMSSCRVKKEIDKIELEIQKILAEADRIDSEEDKIYQ